MFCTTECWDCNDRTCEHYVDKTKLYFENENNKKEIERLNNIINDLEKEIINTIEEARNLQDYSKWYVEGYEEAISLTHSSHSGVMLETIKSTTIKRYEYLLNKLQKLKENNKK